MSRRPPRSTRTDPRCPYPTRFRSFGLGRTATGRVAFLGKFCVANAVGAEMPEILPKLAPGNDHAADIEIADRNRPDGSLADAALFVLIADGDRKSVVKGKSVSVRVDLGGRRNIKQKKSNNKDEKKER